MAVITEIITYHSSGVTAPASLLDGQQAHNDNLGVLYIGEPASAITEIGGSKYTQADAWNIKARNAGTTGYVEDITMATLAGSNFLNLADTYVAIGSHTQGDLLLADVSGNISNLGIGTNGYVLTSNGTTASWVAGSSGSFAGLSDTSIVTPSGGHITVYDNVDSWDNVALDVTLTGDITGSGTLDLNGDLSIATTYANDVVLGTDTSGDYVDSVSGTSNQIAITGTTGEGGVPIIGFTTNVTMPNNLIVAGDLTVQGTTTTVDSTTVTIADPIFTLGNDSVTANDAKDRGIEFKRGNGSGIDTGYFGYDQSTGYFTFIPDGTNTSEVFSGTLGTAQFLTYRSTATTGTAPLVVDSTTLVSNLNADQLDSQEGSYYLSRTNHTGTQAASTISDFSTQVGIDETSHTDVLVDGDFASAGLMKTNGSGTYSIITDNSTSWDAADANQDSWANVAVSGQTTVVPANVSDEITFEEAGGITITTNNTTKTITFSSTQYTHPNHTGDVSSVADGAQTITNTAMTTKTELTSGLAGTDELFVSDGGILKRMDISVMNAYFNANLTFASTGHTHTFLNLTDTPANYTGNSNSGNGYIAKVNVAGDGLEISNRIDGGTW